MAWSLFSSGSSPKSWAVAVLQAGGWPQTAANIQSLIAWALLEGGGGTYNPLNTTQGQGSSFNSVGVKNFGSWSQGVSATVATINNGNYPTIVSDLKAGSGIGATSNLSTWSGGGYSSLGGTWGQAGGYLSGATAALPGGSAPAGGGGGGGGQSSSPDVWSWITGAASGAVDLVEAPFDIGKSIASLAVPFVTISQKIDWLFHPSHWIRIFAGVGGVAFMGFGIWAMTHVGEGPPLVGNLSYQGVSAPLPKANLPMGILSVGIGGVLLFVAFHNVPDSVQNFQQFIGWIFSNINVSTATGTGSGLPGGTPTASGALASNPAGGAAQSGAFIPGVQGVTAGGHGR